MEEYWTPRSRQERQGQGLTLHSTTSSHINDNQCVISPVQGLLPGSLKTVKHVQFTQSPNCTRKTLNSQTQDSLSVSLNVVGHVPFLKGLSQKKDVSPIILPTYKEKLKYVKNVSCVDPLSFASTVQNAKHVAQNLPVGARLQKFWQTWLDLGAGPKVVQILRGLPPPLSDSTKTRTFSHCHKPLCQSPQEQLPVGGITSAYRQKRSGTSTKSKISGLFQLTIFSPKTKQQVEAYTRSEQSKSLPQGGEIQNGDTGNHQDFPPTRGVGDLNRLQGRLLSYPHTGTIQEISEISCRGSDVPVQSSALWSVLSVVAKEVKLMATHKGIKIHQYLDDWLVRARSHQTCLQHTQTLVTMCRDLDWLVNVEKSELEPKQVFDFVGYEFDLRSGRVRPTPDRWQNLQEKILSLPSLPACPVRQFMSLIGLVTATEKQVHLG